jgi:hypothetical protein
VSGTSGARSLGTNPSQDGGQAGADRPERRAIYLMLALRGSLGWLATVIADALFAPGR